MKDYIKCKLSDGGSPRHMNTFSNLFIVTVQYIVDYPRTPCYLPKYLYLVAMWGSYSLLEGFG